MKKSKLTQNDSLVKEDYNNEELTDKAIESLLLEFYDSSYWPAYKKAIDIRISLIDNNLRSIDPFKNPTEMARNQGTIAGLRTIEEIILTIKDSRELEKSQ